MKYIIFIYFYIFLFLFVLICQSSADAHEISKKITEELAHKLIANAHDGSNKYIGDYSYEGDDSEISPPFFADDGMSSILGANGSFGFFAVNPWTGDVWALWECKKLSTPASRKMQAEIKKRFTPEEMKQYPRLSRLKPECT